MKVFYYLLVCTYAFFWPAITFANITDNELINDINSIIQENTTKPSDEKKRQNEDNKIVAQIRASQYKEDDLPKIKNIETSFKVALQVLFGKVLQEQDKTDGINRIRNAAYMLQGTYTFILHGLRYCMNKNFLDTKEEEMAKKFIAKNSTTLKHLAIVLHKTTSITQREYQKIAKLSNNMVVAQFKNAKQCNEHLQTLKENNFSLKAYPQTQQYIEIIQQFLSTDTASKV